MNSMPACTWFFLSAFAAVPGTATSLLVAPLASVTTAYSTSRTRTFMFPKRPKPKRSIRNASRSSWSNVHFCFMPKTLTGAHANTSSESAVIVWACLLPQTRRRGRCAATARRCAILIFVSLAADSRQSLRTRTANKPSGWSDPHDALHANCGAVQMQASTADILRVDAQCEGYIRIGEVSSFHRFDHFAV